MVARADCSKDGTIAHFLEPYDLELILLGRPILNMVGLSL